MDVDVLGEARRVIVSAHDSYDPIDGCVRVSDVEFEQLKKRLKASLK